MKRLLIFTGLLSALVGCGGGNDGVDFNEFVIDEITNTQANDAPAGVNTANFIFNEDENVFDSLL